MLVVALALGISGGILPCLAAAEDIKPIVTVSFAGYDEVRANVEAIGKLGGNDKLASFLEGPMNMMTQGKLLASIDKKAPWGLFVQLGEDGNPTGFGFLPINDLKQFMEAMKATPAGQAISESNGVYEIANPSGEPVYVAQRGKNAIFAKEKAALDTVPSDPEKLLGDLPQKYLLAVRVNVKNIPEQQRDMALGFLTMMSQAGMEQRSEDETDEQYALREKVSKRSMEQLTMVVKETDQLVLGLKIDRSANTVSLDMEIIADAGSKWAAKLAKAKPGKTNLAGVALPDAAIVLNSVGTMDDEDVAAAKDQLQVIHNQLAAEIAKQELTEAQMKLVKEMLDEALTIAQKNLEAKKSDLGLALCLNPTAVTLVAGASVVDGKPIDNLLKKFLDAAKEEEPAVADLVKFNAEEHKGIRFHTLAIPTPSEMEDMKPFVGDTIDVVLGVGDKQAFVAAGRDAAKVLKQVIDKSQSEADKEVQPFQLSISILQIAKFVAAAAPDDETKMHAQMAAGLLEQSGGKDHVLINGQSIENGMKIHIELEEGFLKIIGEQTKSLGGGGPGGMPGAE